MERKLVITEEYANDKEIITLEDYQEIGETEEVKKDCYLKRSITW